MSISARKERERLLREELILDEADAILAVSGYLQLNLDELAQRVEYSKATLYNHFTTKEDLILAVVNRHTKLRGDYFERANLFDGLTRERIFACGIADRLLSRQFPHGFSISQLLQTNSLWSKCSEKRQQEYRKLEERFVAHMKQILRDAVTKKELDPKRGNPDQIMFGLVGLSKGAHLMADSAFLQEYTEQKKSPLDFLYQNYHALLDGINWRPLSTEHDFSASKKRISETLFANELATV